MNSVRPLGISVFAGSNKTHDALGPTELTTLPKNTANQTLQTQTFPLKLIFTGKQESIKTTPRRNPTKDGMT